MQIRVSIDEKGNKKFKFSVKLKAGYVQTQLGNKIINFFKSVLSAIKFL